MGERGIGVTSEARDVLQTGTRGAHQSSAEWLACLAQLQHALMLCPADVQTRCELAMLLERVEQYEEALFNWNAVLVRDPNHLQAREGVARCGPRAGRPLQSKL
jgi:thioredoxin-like negative regulator of GroEL